MKKRNTTKGTNWRPCDWAKYDEGFDRIFRKKTPAKPTRFANQEQPKRSVRVEIVP